MTIQEMLQENNDLREAAKLQWADFNEGKISKAPSVKVESFDMVEKMIRNANQDFSKGRVSIRETLTSTDTVKLIPKVVEGKLREAAEPEYLATRFMRTVQVDQGNSTVYVVPVVGELRAFEVAEGARYNEDSVEFNTLENGTYEIRVKKIGLKVSMTAESIMDSAWDIMGINISKMGRAMARYKEEWAFNNFSDHGHIIFDNNLRDQVPQAGTSGRAEDGSYNNTLSVEDMLDIMLSMMGNDRTPTDLIMHPLTWVVFAKNQMVSNVGMSYGAFNGQNMNFTGNIQGTPGPFGLQANGAGQKFIMSPEQVQGRLPFPIRINFSPFVKFDKKNKSFDMYVLDASDGVGVIAQKEGLQMESWADPEKDISLMKVKERYGIGITDHKAIAVARGLSVAPTYPVPPKVQVITKQE